MTERMERSWAALARQHGIRYLPQSFLQSIVQSYCNLRFDHDFWKWMSSRQSRTNTRLAREKLAVARSKIRTKVAD